MKCVVFSKLNQNLLKWNITYCTCKWSIQNDHWLSYFRKSPELCLWPEKTLIFLFSSVFSVPSGFAWETSFSWKTTWFCVKWTMRRASWTEASRHRFNSSDLPAATISFTLFTQDGCSAALGIKDKRRSACLQYFLRPLYQSLRTWL